MIVKVNLTPERVSLPKLAQALVHGFAISRVSESQAYDILQSISAVLPRRAREKFWAEVVDLGLKRGLWGVKIN